jgi:hypothetical protein
MNMTTTEVNWLKQFTQRTGAVMWECLKLRKRDYDGFVPPDTAEMREMNKKLQEHDGILDVFKRGVLQIASGVGKKK